MRSTLCFRWPLHLLRDTAAAGTIARGKQITKRPQICAHFGHVATDFAAVRLGPQGSRYLSQRAPFTLASKASVSLLTICKKKTAFLRFLTVAPECCTYPIIYSTSWPNTGAARWWRSAEGRKCVKEWKVPCRELRAVWPVPLWAFSNPRLHGPGFDGWHIAEPNSCSQIRDQDTTRQGPGMPGPASYSPALESWEIRHTFQQILAVLHTERQGPFFPKDWKDQSQKWRQVKLHSSSWPGRAVMSGWPGQQKSQRLSKEILIKNYVENSVKRCWL